MKALNGNSKVVVTAVLTAFAMAAIGGTAAIAGPGAKKRTTTAPAKAKAKPKGKPKVAPAKRSVAPIASAPMAPHDEAGERAAFASALAVKLGVTVEQLKAALEAIRPAAGTRPEPGSFPAALAGQLGKTEVEVKTALDALRSEGKVHGPGLGHGRGGHGHGPRGLHGPGSPELVSALAAKLGVTVEELKAAFEAIRPAAGTRPEPGSLPAALAGQLGKTEGEVKAAIEAVRPLGGHRGMGHRGN